MGLLKDKPDDDLSGRISNLLAFEALIEIFTHFSPTFRRPPHNLIHQHLAFYYTLGHPRALATIIEGILECLFSIQQAEGECSRPNTVV